MTPPATRSRAAVAACGGDLANPRRLSSLAGVPTALMISLTSFLLFEVFTG